MSSFVAITINRIHRKGQKPDVIDAKKPFRFEADEFGRLKRLNSVRKATADEIAAYEAEEARLNGADVLAAQVAAGDATVTTDTRKPGKSVGKKVKAAEPEKTADEIAEPAGAGAADGEGDADQSGKNAADDEI